MEAQGHALGEPRCRLKGGQVHVGDAVHLACQELLGHPQRLGQALALDAQPAPARGDADAVRQIVANLLQNVEVSRRAVRIALQNLPSPRECACKDALQYAMVTSLDIVPEETKKRLAPIIGRYLHQKVTG